MEASFRAEFRLLPGVLIVDMQGDLSKSADEGLLALRRWEEGLEGDRRYLVLNFAGVPYINSLGIAVLIRMVRAGAKGGYQTFAYGVTPHYQKLFRMVGLTEYMMIYPDEYSVMQRIGTL